MSEPAHHVTLAYLRQLRTGLWLVFIGTAVGLAVSLWLWLGPRTFLDWIDGIGWADRIVPRRWMAMRSMDLAASACVLVGLWRFFARPPSAATNLVAARGLLNERLRFAVRVMIVVLCVDFVQYAALTIVPWLSLNRAEEVFTRLHSDTGQAVMQVKMWTIFAMRTVVWLSAGFLALRLARRLADERLELALLVALWAVPLFSFGGPIAVGAIYAWTGAEVSNFVISSPTLLSDAAVAALAFFLHRRLKSV
ncbi:MAG: hypothetical protein KF768_10715 [Phycisphaeraceae bacterium]|nr:hypothetical protein [Phycisphaeraceae bacterium]